MRSLQMSSSVYQPMLLHSVLLLHTCTYPLPLLQIKKASAQGEDAWKGAGKTEGLQVWRIVKFKVRQESRFLVTYIAIVVQY